jgi:transcriptional regulator with XRE-family HTH domain
MSRSVHVAGKQENRPILPGASLFLLPTAATQAGLSSKQRITEAANNCPCPTTLIGSLFGMQISIRSGAMACALTRFGQHCRDLRLRRGITLGDQADAFGLQPYEICEIETGKAPAPRHYSQKLSQWLALDEQEQRELFKRVDNNIVALHRSSPGGNRTSSMRLFRKISKLRPNEIRNFSKKPPPEAPE